MKKSPISEFCDSRGIPDTIKQAFSTYLKVEYARKFFLSESGETIHLVMGRLTQEQLEDAWQLFLKELVRYLKT